jgi:hypothetical protein
MTAGESVQAKHDALAAFARETVRQEYFALADGTRGLLQTHERILVAGATLLSGVAGIALAKHTYGLLLALPLMVAAVCLFAMRSMVEILALGAYRRAIEDFITTATGAPTVLWESTIVPTFNNTTAVRAMHALYGAGYVVGLGGSVFVLRTIDADLTGYIAYGIGALVISIALVWSIIAVSKVHDRAYAAASQGLSRASKLYPAPA